MVPVDEHVEVRVDVECELFSGFISSGDGGATWGGTTQTSGPVDLTWLPLTSQGYMVGDYESTSFSGSLAYPAIEVANAPGVICGVVIEAERETGRARSIERIRCAG